MRTAFSCILTLTVMVSAAYGQENRSSSSTSSVASNPKGGAPRKPLDLDKAVGVTELKIQMAESSLRLRPDDRNLSALVAALEDSLNQNCLPNLFKTLSYKGSPTNPDCITKMDRLLEVNPDNPVALCVRDGIDAPSCRDAYRNQRMEVYSKGTGPEKDIVDPTLKVGLSNQETTLIEKFQLQLRPLDELFANAKTDDERKKILEGAAPTYDQMMAVACRVVALRIERRPSADPLESDARFKETREKVLQIPPNMREPYQEKMIGEIELELSKLNKNDTEGVKRLLALIELIRKPDAMGTLTAETSERVRYVLPKCAELMKIVTERIPLFPSPTCHRDGWYSPQCISAIKRWQVYKKQQETPKTKDGEKGTSTAPPSIISTF